MKQSEEILKRKLNVEKLIFSYRELVVPAMEEYAIIKMIEENNSILKMAEKHMDDRAIIVLNSRISELKKQLTEL